MWGGGLIQKYNLSMHFKMFRLLIPILSILALAIVSGCENPNPPTPWPTRTPRPTKTSTPTITPTVTLTPTATTVPVTRAGTPLPVAGKLIDASSAAELKPVARWGQGIPEALAFSPDGSVVALASTRGLYLYDGDTLAAVGAIEPGFGLRCAAFSPDGGSIAAGGEDGKVYLYQVGDGAAVRAFSAHSGPVFALAYSADGQWIATSGWDNAIRIWDAASGELWKQVSDNLAPAQRLAFSPESERLYAWSPSDQVLNWEVKNGRAGRAIYVGVDVHNHSGTSAAFSPDGQYFVSDQDTRARAAILSSGNTLVTINQRSPLQNVAIAAGGAYVAGTDGSSLFIWQGQGGALARQFTSPAGLGVFDFLAFSADGTKLVSAGDTLRLWRVDAEEDAPTATGPSNFQTNLRLSSAFSPDGSALTQLLAQGGVQSYRLADGSPLAVTGVPAGLANAAALSADGKLAATAGADNQVALWRMADGQQLFALKGHTRMAVALAFSPDGKLLASGSSDGMVLVWETDSGAQAAALEAPGGALRLAFMPDGKRMAVGVPDKTLFWQTQDWTPDGGLPGRDLVISTEGDLLAVVDDRQEPSVVNLYGPQGGKEPRVTLPVYGSSMAFSPDGSLLAVSSDQISLWSTGSGERVGEARLPVSHGQVAFSPDGKLLVLSTWDGVVYVWAAP